MQVRQGKLHRRGIAVQVVQAEALEIRDQHVAGQFVVGDAGEIVGGLLVGGIQIDPGALVFGQHHPRPEHVDAAMLAAGEPLGLLLEHRHPAAVDAKDVEEFVPEALRFGTLAGFVGPLLGECPRPVPDFVDAERHADPLFGEHTTPQTWGQDGRGTMSGGGVGSIRVCRCKSQPAQGGLEPALRTP
nr:hypothetical protein [Pseudoxanthomonas kalamensis]